MDINVSIQGLQAIASILGGALVIAGAIWRTGRFMCNAFKQQVQAITVTAARAAVTGAMESHEAAMHDRQVSVISGGADDPVQLGE